jgi:hypothetical protein
MGFAVSRVDKKQRAFTRKVLRLQESPSGSSKWKFRLQVQTG